MFSLSLLASMMYAISSSNWLTIWMMMEINSMSFIILSSTPLMMENMMKYFLIQTLASIFLLIQTVPQPMMSSSSQTLYISVGILLITAMIMKMGATPFHFWILEVSKNMKWKNLIIFLSIQKIAPLIIMMNSEKTLLISLAAVTSVVIGALMLMMSSNMKIVLTTSSINHMGWLMMASIYSTKLMIIYMSYYITTITQTFKEMEKKKIEYLSWEENQEKKSMLIIFMMSMAGVPPFLGFFPKMMIILSMASKNFMIMISMVILIMSIITTNIYFRLSMKTMMKSKKTTNKKSKMKPEKKQILIQIIGTVMIISF